MHSNICFMSSQNHLNFDFRYFNTINYVLHKVNFIMFEINIVFRAVSGSIEGMLSQFKLGHVMV